jgi:hypothetical protein
MNLMYMKRRIYREAASEGSASGGDGSISGAANAFSSFLGSEAPAESEPQQNNDPEAAAERLIAEEAESANQNNAEQGDEQQGDQETTDDTVTFEVDGKPVTVTKAELAELHKGNLRQKDYTQKTQEVAETRKAAEAEIQKAKAERDAYVQNLQQILMVNQHAEQQAQKWTPDEIQADPIGYLVFTQSKEARQQQTQAAYAELQKIDQEQQQERAKAHQDFILAQHQALVEKMPEWKDPMKMKEGVSKLETYMIERGFKPEDGTILLDARFMMLANDAMKYRDLLARAAKAGEKVAAVPPKVERPGVARQNSPIDQRTAAMKHHANKGSIDSAANAFAQFLKG